MKLEIRNKGLFYFRIFVREFKIFQFFCLYCEWKIR